MDPELSASERFGISDEYWESCREDGFVYKRRKRLRVSEETVAGESPNPPQTIAGKAPNPAEEERNREEGKSKILVKLKRKYKKEIVHWEILSNTLCALREKSKLSHIHETTSLLVPSSSSSSPSLIESQEQIIEKASSVSTSSLLDELFAMEEAREGIIQNVSNLCEVAEEMCREKEEEEDKEEKETLFNLPVWSSSPKSLMTYLCFDDT